MPQIKTQIEKRCRSCKKKFFVILRRKKTAKFCSHKCQGKGKYNQDLGKRMAALPSGKFRTLEWRAKASTAKLDHLNPMWKGKDAGLDAVHIWVLRRKPKPKLCECCKKKKPIDLANISQKYKRDVKDFEWLCRRCHMKKDGRLKKFTRIRHL